MDTVTTTRRTMFNDSNREGTNRLAYTSLNDRNTLRHKQSHTQDRLEMSGYYYQPTSSPEDEGYAFTQGYASQTMQPRTTFPEYRAQYSTAYIPPQDFYNPSLQQYQQPQQYQPIPAQQYQPMMDQPWTQQSMPSNYAFAGQTTQPFPQYQEIFNMPTETIMATSSVMPTGYLSPGLASRPRASRATSFASNASSVSDVSRSVSPNASEMLKWGYRNEDGSWSCAYPGCSSKSTFHRGCDLRKHYKRHSKTLFCRHDGCPQATEGGFSSKKDRARHEAKHNPNIVCEWEGCERLFSRQDNMKDHVRRVHRRQTA